MMQKLLKKMKNEKVAKGRIIGLAGPFQKSIGFTRLCFTGCAVIITGDRTKQSEFACQSYKASLIDMNSSSNSDRLDR